MFVRNSLQQLGHFYHLVEGDANEKKRKGSKVLIYINIYRKKYIREDIDVYIRANREGEKGGMDTIWMGFCLFLLVLPVISLV